MDNHIKEYREKLGLTQEQLADLVGVTRQTINALEHNRYNPSLVLAYNITKVLKAERIEEVFELE